MLKFYMATLEPQPDALALPTLTTTCFFHIGGFAWPLGIMFHKYTRIFNAGIDLDTGDTCQKIYEQVDLS